LLAEGGGRDGCSRGEELNLRARTVADRNRRSGSVNHVGEQLDVLGVLGRELRLAHAEGVGFQPVWSVGPIGWTER
jgi:hypothetical protein